MSSDKQKLLTIGIPTYNRKEELDKSLRHLLPQVLKFEDQIELIVEDNASTIDLRPVIDKYNNLGLKIIYIKNSENLGMDGNFSMLFENSTAKYVWLLSDDDIVVENGVQRVINILSDNEIGSLYLSNIWFAQGIDFSKFDSNEETKFTLYKSSLAYFKRVNYWITFLSANIVNKNLIKDKIHLRENQGTFLALLDWIVPAMFASESNIFMDTPILACNAKNQGGYKFIEVFAVNMNKIIDNFIKRGYPKEIKKIVNKALLKDYFPQFIISKRSNKLKDTSSYKKENWFLSLFKVYKFNKDFYIHAFPCFILKGRFLYKWKSFW